MARRCSLPSGAATSTASSASTNAARSPRKCAAMTGPPAATGRVRSTTEGCAPGSVTAARSASGRARGETLADHLLRQVAADEYDAALARFIRRPGALVIAVQDHVDALEHETVRIVLECQDTLGTQDARTFLRDQVLDPRRELVGIERLV